MQNICPRCQSPIPLDAPGGLCPACVLRGVAAPTNLSQAAAMKAPALEEVTSAFPELEVLDLIGQGGMGVVFKVRQPKLNRLAALKLLPQSLAADPAFAGRFEREAQLLAKLSHPNIVSVYDYGQAGGFFYLLMEHVDGVNLRQAMRASRFTPAQALGIVPKICEALQFAHDEGVLHRDIKPENILLDAKGRVKLVDFGIAKLIGDGTHESHVAHTAHEAHLTQAATALGTPAYMAPEQRTTPGDVDHRADIYSLGVVFYELLTGELPRGSLVQPSTKSDADPRVDAIVAQALENERERRQRSAGEMRTQVETIAGETRNAERAARNANGGSRKPRKWRRAVAIGVASLLALGAVLWLADFLLPPVYFSRVTMEIKPDNSPGIGATFSNRAGYPPLDPMFISTQFQVLQKTEILYPVIENLKLVESWSTEAHRMRPQSAYKKLLRMLEIREVRNTGLIEIGAYSNDAQEAANIANTIAVVYQQKRLTDLQKNIDKGLEQLKDEVEKQRKLTDMSAAEMAKIRESLNIVDPNPFDFGAGTGNQIEIPTDPAKRDGINSYQEAKMRYLQSKRIFEAAQTKYSTSLFERGIDFDPTKIWEKAEPAAEPLRFMPPLEFSFRRFRNAFAR